jgi:predicted ATPase
LDAIQVGPKRSNLPVSLTPFVGREKERAAIQARLRDPDCRLLTLVGPGGIGKTRLAVEAASAQTDAFPYGVFFVPLAPLQSADAIVPTMAQALGFSFYEGTEPRQQLLDHLRQKRALLVMDNFEHLLSGVDLVTDILRTARDVKILATSRERLNVRGEHLCPITGMDYPEETAPTTEESLIFSAVQLFLQSAQQVRPELEPTNEYLAEVGHICRLVEGMPLAILLAAGWVQMLKPKEIAAEIKRGIDVLETDLRDVPVRHRSMRAVFDHSWNLLSPQQRGVMETLSVFRGGFTLAAAQEVSGATLRELMALVNKSLLQRTPSGRYDVHSLLRDYAAEALQSTGQAASSRDAHASYYAAFMQAREVDLKGRRQLAALDEIEADFENVRSAWEWALARKDCDIIGRELRSLGWFCEYKSRHRESQELFRRARERLAPGSDQDPHLVWGRILVAEFYGIAHEVDKAQVEKGLAIAQKHGDREVIAVGLRTLGEAASSVGDYAQALSLYEQSLAVSRELDDLFDVAAALYKLAETHRLLGHPQEAIRFARQSLALSREIGDQYWAASSLANTGVMAFYAGNFSEAEGYLREANALYRKMGYRAGIAGTSLALHGLGLFGIESNEREALGREALEIARDIGKARIAQAARYLPAWLVKRETSIVRRNRFLPN